MIKALQIFIIITIFAIPSVGFYVTPNDYVVKGENRIVNKFPEKDSIKFYSEIVNWFNDRLLFKIYAVENLYPYYNFYFKDFNLEYSNLFSVEGLKGWYFLGDQHNKVYSQHSSEIIVNENFINYKIQTLKKIKNAVSGKFYYVVGPDKHGIYSEFMNPGINEPGLHRHFNKLRKFFDAEDIDVIDNYETLREHKDKTNKNSLYFTDDSHWNSYGAHIAFENVMNRILDNYKPIKYQYVFSKHPKGDLIVNNFTPRKDILDEATVVNYKSYPIAVTYLENGKRNIFKFDPNHFFDFGVKIENSNAIDSRKIMLITDSYGKAFSPYVIDYFKTVIHVHRLETEQPLENTLKIISKEKPDIVLYINVERNT